MPHKKPNDTPPPPLVPKPGPKPKPLKPGQPIKPRPEEKPIMAEMKPGFIGPREKPPGEPPRSPTPIFSGDIIPSAAHAEQMIANQGKPKPSLGGLAGALGNPEGGKPGQWKPKPHPDTLTPSEAWDKIHLTKPHGQPKPKPSGSLEFGKPGFGTFKPDAEIGKPKPISSKPKPTMGHFPEFMGLPQPLTTQPGANPGQGKPKPVEWSQQPKPGYPHNSDIYQLVKPKPIIPQLKPAFLKKSIIPRARINHE